MGNLKLDRMKAGKLVAIMPTRVVESTYGTFGARPCLSRRASVYRIHSRCAASDRGASQFARDRSSQLNAKVQRSVSCAWLDRHALPMLAELPECVGGIH